MRADLDAISHLVDDLFLLAAIEAGRLDVGRETFDLTELVDEAIEALQPVAARKQVSIRLFGDRVLVDGGVAELGRVIRNLLHNAIRHTPEGSVVCIEVGCDPAPELVVRDEGPGFDPDLAARAFDQFVTGDSARTRGTGRSGLGLAIAKGIVQAHGGEVWVGSGPGGEVGFRLPARL